MRNGRSIEERKKTAIIASKHILEMEQRYPKEIEYSVQNTLTYLNEYFQLSIPSEEKAKPSIIVEDLDTLATAFKYNSSKKTALLNFADFRKPGGGFLTGSKVQEECLCHESILYNVLSRFQDVFYTPNANYINGEMYANRALYSKDVLFIRDNEMLKCDVITCASPNCAVAYKKYTASKKKNYEALLSRIRFTIDIAEDQQVETLILGAFGCGAFGQDPNEVADIFSKNLEKTKYIRNVIFGIPNVYNSNYIAFERIFS